VIKEETGNILKYRVTLAIKCMWNVKFKVRPVITGTISKSLRQYLSNSGKARYQRKTENSHNGHCTHTSESKR
jgi:hypothetical protein